jgi:hypothetical protein
VNESEMVPETISRRLLCSQNYWLGSVQNGFAINRSCAREDGIRVSFLLT